jgi:hypothetical protein
VDRCDRTLPGSRDDPLGNGAREERVLQKRVTDLSFSFINGNLFPKNKPASSHFPHPKVVATLDDLHSFRTRNILLRVFDTVE